MKFNLNKVTLALVAVAATAPMAASAGVTVSPLLLGYHYTDKAAEKQREVLKTGKNLYADVNNEKSEPFRNESRGTPNGGVAQQSGLYTGAALGIELTPSTQFQVEYGVSNSTAQASADSAVDAVNVFDAEQTTISGNFLIGTEQLTGYTNGSFKPYVLVGGGQSKLKIENQNPYHTSPGQTTQTGERSSPNARLPAGTLVAETTNKIGNLGLGAMYRINDALSLRGEGRATYNFDDKWWEGTALAGLEVVLGGHLAPAVVVPPVVEPEPEVVEVIEQPTVVEVPPVIEVQPVQEEIDSDGDGVVDSIDACPNTPMNLVVDARGCPIQVEIEDELKMELRVFFDNDKSNIKPQYKPEIAKVAEKMREYPNSTARIEGNASKTGPSARYNQRLSEARAVAVKSMLSNEFGIAPNRMTTIGYGYDRPIAPNNTPEGRAMNRRVYAIITGNKTMTVDQTKDMVVQ